MTWDYIAGFFDGEGSAGCYSKAKRSGQRFINFSNTERELLLEIRDFLGAGIVGLQKTSTPTRRPCYVLYIRKIEDLRRIAPELRRRCIIKRDALDRVLADIEGRQPARNPGRITAVGVDGIRRLYWDDGLSAGAIARRLGVTPGSVSEFMHRHEIPMRSVAERYELSGRGGLAALGVDEVRRLYWDELLSMREIGKTVGVGPMSVMGYMRRHDIPTRPKRVPAKG